MSRGSVTSQHHRSGEAHLWARIGVKAAILRDHRLLLLQRREDLDLFPALWDLPGGGVRSSDLSLERALIREVFEETAYRVRVGPVLDVSFRRIRVRDEPRFPSAVVTFRCATRSPAAPRLDSNEHTAYAWASVADVRRLPVVPRQKRALWTALHARQPGTEPRVDRGR